MYSGGRNHPLQSTSHYVMQVWNLCAVCAQIMRAAGCSLFKREPSPRGSRLRACQKAFFDKLTPVFGWKASENGVFIHAVRSEICIFVFLANLLRDQAAARCPCDVHRILHTAYEVIVQQVFLRLLIALHARRPLKRGAGARLQEDLLRSEQVTHVIIELSVPDGELAAEQVLHDPAHKSGGPPHRKPIGVRQPRKADVLHRNVLILSRCHAQQHTGRLRGLHEKAMHAVAEQELHPEAHAARRAAHTARNIDKERMCGIHGDALRL